MRTDKHSRPTSRRLYHCFFAELGPLTQSGLLADGNVGIYPVNSATSQFYPEQLNGLDLLGDP